MTEQQIELLNKNTTHIAVLKEQHNVLTKRMDENDKIIGAIYEISANVQALTLQMKNLTNKLDENMANVEERVKALTKKADENSKSIEVRFKQQGERIGILENEPGTKWKSVSMQVIGLLVAGAVGYFLSKF